MERPILFSTPMVQAIMSGTKTQTRRVVKNQPVYDEESGYKFWDNLMFDIHDNVLETMYMPDHCKFGEIGDILWVRETYLKLVPEHFITSNYVYKSDMCPDSEEVRQQYIKQGYPYNWKPSIFMPRDACRIRLEITNIRVERLHEITEKEAQAEGAEFQKWEGITETTQSYLNGFTSVWLHINGDASWNSNPWVWVIEFKRIES